MKCRICGSFNIEVTDTKFRCKKCGHTEKHEAQIFSDVFESNQEEIFPCRMCKSILS